MTNWAHFIVASDLHGDMQESSAVNALRKFCREWKPTLRIFAGDLDSMRQSPLVGSGLRKQPCVEIDIVSVNDCV